MSTLNVFRWTAFGAGIVYGLFHSYSLSSASAKRAATAEWAHKEALIAKAKEEYAKLHPKPAAPITTATLDFSDPNFDFA
ncbi:ATP synthase E chain-domain-containing protein [Lipomyces kononenkoae]|uniref:ATP synthase E chain-domain-containing protein n=1 Tax=Lipomyces kononenkoae TaxID=34357 RepID=A0ACC3T4W7_LIPKO